MKMKRVFKILENIYGSMPVTYTCSWCHIEYPSEEEMDDCEKKHEERHG